MNSYSLKELFELWIEYLEYYDVTFQKLSRTSGLEYSFPKWLEENDKKVMGYTIRSRDSTNGDDFYQV